METKKVVGAVVILVAVIGVLVVFVGLPATSTQFHYEARLEPSDPDGCRIILQDLMDTNVTITFVNDPTLWYRMDVTQYESGRYHDDEVHRFDTHLSLAIDDVSGRIQDINLVLGTGVSYGIDILGENVNATIIFDNGAILKGQTLMFSATGVLRFRLTEDVVFTDLGMRVRAEPTFPDVVLLDIDLPDGLNGDLEAPDVTFVLNEWPIGLGNHYGTISTDEPLHNLAIQIPPVVASLMMINGVSTSWEHHLFEHPYTYD